MGDRGADALQAAVGVGDGALLLGVRLGRDVDVGGLGGRAVEHRDAEGEVGGGEGGPPALGIVEVADRIDVGEDQGLDLARLERGADLGGRTPAGGDLGEAGAEVLGAADLAEAAAVGGERDLVEAAAVHAVEAEHVGEAQQGGGDLLAVVAGEHALAPDDDDRAGVAQGVGETRGLGVRGAGTDRRA